MGNPLEIDLQPSKKEQYSDYRNGLEVLTFETPSMHICYGLDRHGNVWDFCSIGKEIWFVAGKLSDQELKKAYSVVKDFEKTFR